VTTGHHTKTTAQPCIIMLHNNKLRPHLTTWKNPLLPPWKISFRHPSSFVCRSGFLKLFAHVPLSIKSIFSRHLIYSNIIIQLYKSDHAFQFQSTNWLWRRSSSQKI